MNSTKDAKKVGVFVQLQGSGRSNISSKEPDVWTFCTRSAARKRWSFTETKRSCSLICFLPAVWFQVAAWPKGSILTTTHTLGSLMSKSMPSVSCWNLGEKTARNWRSPQMLRPCMSELKSSVASKVSLGFVQDSAPFSLSSPSSVPWHGVCPEKQHSGSIGCLRHPRLLLECLMPAGLFTQHAWKCMKKQLWKSDQWLGTRSNCIFTHGTTAGKQNILASY